jgi:hypothetical protein
VVISVVWVTKGNPKGPFDLDGRSVPIITAYLFHAGGHENPVVLRANAAKSFIGSYVLGMGFTFDDTDAKGIASSIAEMHRLIGANPRNAERIFPYIGGEEANDSPTHAHHRFVINFEDFPLRRDKLKGTWELADADQRREWLSEGVVPNDYPHPVAADWPDLLAILDLKVRPERMKQGSIVNPKRWYRFARPASDFRIAVKDLGVSKVLVISRIQPNWGVCLLSPEAVFAESIVLFAFDRLSAFSILQSRAHEVWARFTASSMKDDMRYAPTDCFETFPFPIGFETIPMLEQAGRQYYEFRAALMVRNNEGLTKTYNRFHDPQESAPAIIKLRELHARMDAAVLAAYAWEDLIPKCQCDFILDYEDEDDDESEGKSRKRKKPWRFRWSDEVRDEVLARLLKLNAERAEQELLAGEAVAKSAKPAKKAKAKVSKAGKMQLGLGISTSGTAERKLPTDFRLPVSQPLLYTTNLVVALLSEAGGSLSWPRLLDAFILATTPKLIQRLAPADDSSRVKAWAARWNETVTDGLLIPSLNQLGAKNLTVTKSNEGPVFHLLDGPRPLATEDVRYDAWLALRVAATLTPDAVQIPDRAKWTKEANKLVFA